MTNILPSKLVKQIENASKIVKGYLTYNKNKFYFCFANKRHSFSFLSIFWHIMKFFPEGILAKPWKSTLYLPFTFSGYRVFKSIICLCFVLGFFRIFSRGGIIFFWTLASGSTFTIFIDRMLKYPKTVYL